MVKKDMIGLLAMAAMFEGSLGVPRTARFDEKKVTGKLKGEHQKKGMRKFEIDGKVIYALNEKNAIRKAKQMQ